MLTGIGASGGIGIGKVLIYREPDIRYADRAVSNTAAEKSVRFCTKKQTPHCEKRLSHIFPDAVYLIFSSSAGAVPNL